MPRSAGGMRRVKSPGWGGAPVLLGEGQAYLYAELERSVKHPSRMWHPLRALRAFGKSPGTVHRTLQRLAALGLIALQSKLGCEGFVRFTFGVRRWKFTPPSRRQVARMARMLAAPGQLVLAVATAAEPIPRPPPLELRAPANIAPTLWDACDLCGATDRVRAGLYRALEGSEPYAWGHKCIDHDACAARQAAR